ncbi:UNVERIFIED_ORG: hypothetical protein ABIB63_000746 [Xanthomonas axonopodis]
MPLFAQVLGQAAFAQLPAPVRALHSVQQRQTFVGRARIERGAHALVPLLAMLSRLPRSGEVAVEVDFLTDAHGERWHRRFDGMPMHSRLWRHGDRLREHLGAVRFEFSLQADAQSLYWQATGVWAFGLIRLPGPLVPAGALPRACRRRPLRVSGGRAVAAGRTVHSL